MTVDLTLRKKVRKPDGSSFSKQRILKEVKENICHNKQLTIFCHQIRVGLFSERRKTKELLRRSLVRELTSANAGKPVPTRERSQVSISRSPTPWGYIEFHKTKYLIL